LDPIPMLVSKLDLDWDEAAKEILAFIKKIVSDSGAKGCVIGLSGGVDSSLVGKLLVLAIGRERVLGALMPTAFTPGQDVADANWLANELEIRSEKIEIQPIVDAFAKALGTDPDASAQKIPLANIRARVRMVILYYLANLNNYLVAGTGDRSEDLIGYFTKYGDGGVDFLPISHLYKTQVRGLARHLGLPERICDKISSPQLYPGHRATDEIPADYEQLDPVLQMLFDESKSPTEVAERTKVDKGTIDEIIRRVQNSNHKRAYPTMVRNW
jgi:NAD+ synthase